MFHNQRCTLVTSGTTVASSILVGHVTPNFQWKETNKPAWFEVRHLHSLVESKLCAQVDQSLLWPDKGGPAKHGSHDHPLGHQSLLKSIITINEPSTDELSFNTSWVISQICNFWVLALCFTSSFWVLYKFISCIPSLKSVSLFAIAWLVTVAPSLWWVRIESKYF